MKQIFLKTTLNAATKAEAVDFNLIGYVTQMSKLLLTHTIA